MNAQTAYRNSLLTVLIAAAFLLSQRIDLWFRFPYPPFNQLIFDISNEFSDKPSFARPLGSEGGFRDIGGLLMGFRRFTADIAWVSALQYYGSHEAAQEGSSFGGGNYPALKRMVQRIVRLDPNFHFAYLYGAGSLAFNLERYDEAAEILEEGIRYNPTYWNFRLYVAAILWKKKGDYGRLVPLLEEAIRYPDCPNLIKSCLANIYKVRRNYKRALQIWIEVLESPNLDETYHRQAEEQITELTGQLGL